MNDEQLPTKRRILDMFTDRVDELYCNLRQRQFPPEFRIARTPGMMERADMTKPTERINGGGTASSLEQCEQSMTRRAIAEVAVCLWDIQRKLQTSEVAQQDRKLRLLNRRAEKAIAALGEMGVVIEDPIGRRYATGSEASMKPNFQPTPGTTYEKVIETIAPMVYRGERLIGRGEVFVAVPIALNPEAETPAPEITSPDMNGPEQVPSADEPPAQDSPSAATTSEMEQIGSTAPSTLVTPDDQGLPEKPAAEFNAK